MILSSRNKALAAFYASGNASRLSVPDTARVGRILRVLAGTNQPEDASLPGYHFHTLRGEPRWSIRVTGNWRITFGWDGADAVDVDLEDDH